MTQAPNTKSRPTREQTLLTEHTQTSSEALAKKSTCVIMTEIKEVIENCCWQARRLLTHEECQAAIHRGLSTNIQERQSNGDVRHRNSCTVYFEDEVLASALWERLQSTVPDELEFVGESSVPDGFLACTAKDIQGRWRPYGVNPNFLLLYYKDGGYFGPHRDSYKIISEHERSMLTVCMYLIDRPAHHGGATNFLHKDMDCPAVDEDNRIRSPQDEIVATVQSDEAGKGVMFVHDLMHEGEPLEVRRLEDGRVDKHTPATPKWSLITQVLYRREAESAPQLTEQQKEARHALQAAEQAEVDGNIPEAIRLYSRAYRLDPSLE